MNYWLLKTEPETFSWAMQKKKGAKGTTKKSTPPRDPTPSTVAEPVVEKSKKKMGSPRKGAKSPGAVTTKGGENFTSIPPIKK